MKINWGTVTIVILLTLFLGGFAYSLNELENTQVKHQSCIEQYPLDSCELYKCRAENSNWVQDVKFNHRNYEICKIIINKNMSFNESLPLLNTVRSG